MFENQKTTKKVGKTTIIAIVAIFIAGTANAKSNIAKTAKPLNLNEMYELKLADDTKGTSDFKIVITEDGNLTISFETFAKEAYATLFNKDGSLEPVKSDVVSGQSYYTNLRWADKTYSQGLVLSWHTNTEQFKGNFIWELNAGTYYLRASRSTKGLSSANISVSFKNKTLIEEELQIQQAETERQLQLQKAEQERQALLTLIVFGVFIVLIIVFYIRSKLKAKERKKYYQPVFAEIFKEQGFSATDIIWTNCQYKVKDCEVVNNIVLGFKNGVVSFFGGGSSMIKFEAKDERVVFYNIATVSNWEKLLKEDSDFLLSDGSVAKTLFLKNDKFRHLFDIPIYNIKDYGKKLKGKDVEIFIECYDNLIKLSPFCGNIEPKNEIMTAIISALNKIIENGMLSKIKISVVGKID